MFGIKNVIIKREYYVNPNICISGIIFIFFYFALEKFISKNCKYIFFYQKFVHLGEYTSKYCSRIIVVHVHATVFLKFTQRVTILQTVSNQEMTLKEL